MSLFVHFFGLCLLLKTGRLSFHVWDIQTICNHFKAVEAEWLNREAHQKFWYGKQDSAGSDLCIYIYEKIWDAKMIMGC